MTSRKISLDGTHKQIIDLNEDMVNFVVEFTITPQQSDMEKPYEIAITTQEKLDSGVEAKFTQIRGVFNKTIKNTTGTYQNYCLMISSKTEIKDITIVTKLSEIAVEQPLAQQAPVQQVPQVPQGQASQHVLLQEQAAPIPTPTHEHITNTDTGKKFKIIVGVLVVIIGGCALYYFWNKSKKGAVSVTTEVPSVDTPNSVVSPTAVPTVLKTPSTTFSFY
jgi:hypothetical protein